MGRRETSACDQSIQDPLIIGRHSGGWDVRRLVAEMYSPQKSDVRHDRLNMLPFFDLGQSLRGEISLGFSLVLSKPAPDNLGFQSLALGFVHGFVDPELFLGDFTL